MAESGAYYFITYYSPSPPNDGKRHRIKVTTRRTDVEVRAREEYVSPAKAPKAVPAGHRSTCCSGPRFRPGV